MSDVPRTRVLDLAALAFLGYGLAFMGIGTVLALKAEGRSLDDANADAETQAERDFFSIIARLGRGRL